jgi:hypothetical protein
MLCDPEIMGFQSLVHNRRCDAIETGKLGTRTLHGDACGRRNQSLPCVGQSKYTALALPVGAETNTIVEAHELPFWELRCGEYITGLGPMQPPTTHFDLKRQGAVHPTASSCQRIEMNYLIFLCGQTVMWFVTSLGAWQ